eukprot:3672746-Prymnesium_polylepis.1
MRSAASSRHVYAAFASGMTSARIAVTLHSLWTCGDTESHHVLAASAPTITVLSGPGPEVTLKEGRQ